MRSFQSLCNRGRAKGGRKQRERVGYFLVKGTNKGGRETRKKLGIDEVNVTDSGGCSVR